MFNSIRFSSLAALAGACLLAATAVPQLRAGGVDGNNKTVMTFSGPVQISGEALAAGTYVFKTFQGDRDLVEIMNGDETHLVALVRAVPIEQGASQGVLPDEEQVDITPAAEPNGLPLMHSWYYPGERVGWEFPAVTTAATE